MRTSILFFVMIFIVAMICAQQIAPPATDQRLFEIIEDVSAANIEADIRALVSFGTRHTASDTLSDVRGIGAARRWIYSRMEQISATCNGCLEVSYLGDLIKGDPKTRIPVDTRVVNVLAIKRGTRYPNRYIIMAGDIDSRVSDVLNFTDDSPGANDNASGMAGVIEAARVLSAYDFESSILFVGLSGEEQGLYGGKILAEYAQLEGWEIVGVLNNDMIGNIRGINGVIDNRSFRIFSEAASPTETEQQRIWKRFYGGEVDGVSRQLARYIEKITLQYMPEMRPMMIYRLDRFGRGGHHRPFNDVGFAGVRIMEAYEDYNRQHQDLRTENGIEYGDVIESVNFDFAAKLTAVNAINLASIAWAPAPPTAVMIGGAVMPDTRLRWTGAEEVDIAGYKIYWRETTNHQWQYSRYVGNLSEFTLQGIVIDNYLFGVAAVGLNGHESVVVYPTTLIPRR